jgi:uncharacterized protein (TIGR03067 family)
MPAPIAASLLLACLFAPFADDEPTGDLKKMQGTWEGLVQLQDEVPILLEIKGDKITVTVKPPEGDEVHLEGKIKLDEKADPRRIDFVEFVGTDGNSMPDNLGIYKFVNDDELMIRTGGPDNDRPKVIDGNDGTSLVLNRSKAKKID